MALGSADNMFLSIIRLKIRVPQNYKQNPVLMIKYIKNSQYITDFIYFCV